MTPLVNLTAIPSEDALISPYTLRAIQAEDFIDLARLFNQSTLMNPIDVPVHLSGWIDHMVALFEDQFGKVLDACSFILEGRAGPLGGIIVTLHDNQPHIWNIAMTQMHEHAGMIRALIRFSLNQLDRSGYTIVHAQSIADSFYTPLLFELGFVYA